MTSEVTIRVLRDDAINANDRLHWSGKSLKTRNLRSLAGWKARSVGLVKCKRATINVYVATSQNRGDVANWHPTVKALLDGLVDYGVLPDDSDKFLSGPFLHRDARRAQSGCVEFRVVVTPMEA